ncbi:MFS transporter [Deinococcus sp. Leaf326]|uniref:MFS transporter n=1 Tax=Deinococcus sp. Leaf326 TaxID=1736338 RepID=UPI0006FBD6FE|nr:MFS transporter [Deinococcus sp. Leaf326]KQQ99442.1 MFS transporter [Deinococcus sp. Leaf326]
MKHAAALPVPVPADSAAPRAASGLPALYVSQALATGATTVSTILASIIMGGLGQGQLSGLPSTLISLSAALSAGAFGAFMLRRGRRLGLGLAFTLGALGAALGFVGARLGTVPLFLLGATLMGGAQGGYQQARYAVAENVPPARRGRALGLLMLMSVAGSFVMTGFARPVEALGAALGTSPEVAGWLVGGGLLGVAALLVLGWGPRVPAGAAARPPALHWRVVFSQPGVRSTALALATAQGVMVTLMSLTPLRAHHAGMDHVGVAALISGHILGMFGFGWFTGPVLDRLGLRFGYVSGALLLLAAALSAALPGTAWLGVSMFVLGLGWNLVNLGGSKAMTRFPAAQGVTDGLGYVAAGLGTFLGGLVIARAGFGTLAALCGAIALLPLLSAWRAGPRRA